MSGFELPESDTSSEDEDEEDDEFPYDPKTPFFVDLSYDRQPPNVKYYKPLFLIDEITKFNPSFEMPQNVDASAGTLCELFLPDRLLDKWVRATTDYAASYLPRAKQRNINRADVCCFLAVIQYMGVCRLPAKKDYFPGKLSTKTHKDVGHQKSTKELQTRDSIHAIHFLTKRISF
jgi:hypothetical protein